jgi:pimeloyl-ACP methyl ester carboxylesterase
VLGVSTSQTTVGCFGVMAMPSLARPARAEGLQMTGTPRCWVEKAYPNVIYFNEVDKGGHFAAWEEPGLFSEELRAAFRPLR